MKKIVKPIIKLLLFGPSSFVRENIFGGRKKLMGNHYIAVSENNEYGRLFSDIFTFFLEHFLLNVQYSPVGCLKVFLIVCREEILSNLL